MYSMLDLSVSELKTKLKPESNEAVLEVIWSMYPRNVARIGEFFY